MRNDSVTLRQLLEWLSPARLVTAFPRLTLLLAVILALPAAYRTLHTPINYDMYQYMPASIESIHGQQILSREFESTDTAFLLVSDLTTPRILEIKRGIGAIEGVKGVDWLSSLVDPAVPAMFLPPEIARLYLKDNHALLHITFDKPPADFATMDAYKRVCEYLESQRIPPRITGLPALIAELRDLINSEKVKAAVAAVVIAGLAIRLLLGSLLLTVIFLSTIGLGVIYNLGSSPGQLSYITESMVATIQMGVTLDFSVFLTHRFREELGSNPDAVAAMRRALRVTRVAILPSALTTVAGFLTLGLMQLGIGTDLGFTMAKGVIMGLICAQTVLPAALLAFRRFDGLAGSAAARPEGFATLITQHPRILLLVFVLAFFPAAYGRYHADLSYTMADSLPDNLSSIRSIAAIKDAMGSIELNYVLVPETVPAFVRQNLMRDLEKLDCVSQAYGLERFVDSGIPASFIPPEIRRQFVRGGYSLITLNLDVVGGSPEGNAAIDEIRRIAHAMVGEAAIVTGLAAISRDLTFMSQRDIPRVNLASVLVVMAIIMLSFRSLSIPLILVAGIQLAIFINLAFAWLFGTTLPFLTFTAIGAIQLGATVDYAILLMARYREERLSFPAREAMRNALAKAAPAIVTSGMCLFAATIGVTFVNDVAMIQSMCLLIARGAIISMLVILTLLPAVITGSDRLIRWTTQDTKGWV